MPSGACVIEYLCQRCPRTTRRYLPDAAVSLGFDEIRFAEEGARLIRQIEAEGVQDGASCDHRPSEGRCFRHGPHRPPCAVT